MLPFWPMVAPFRTRSGTAVPAWFRSSVLRAFVGAETCRFDTVSDAGKEITVVDPMETAL